MGLPNQLKSARMTDATVGNLIDDNVGLLEQAICDILGITIDTNVTESPLSCDNSGRITKALLRQVAAPPVGYRFRDSSNNKEFRLVLNNTSILMDENTGTESVPVWTNRLTIALGTGLITLAGATDPSGNNDLARRGYVDTLVTGLSSVYVALTGDQTVAGVKTFSSFPVTPSSAPTTDYQVANKKFVADQVAASIPAVEMLRSTYMRYSDRKSNGTNGGTGSLGDWYTRDLNTEEADYGNIGSLSNNRVSLPAGWYYCKAHAPFNQTLNTKIRIWNYTDSAAILTGNNSGCTYGGLDTHAFVEGYFNLPATKEISVQYRIQSYQDAKALGGCHNIGEDEIYTVLELWKVS